MHGIIIEPSSGVPVQGLAASVVIVVPGFSVRIYYNFLIIHLKQAGYGLETEENHWTDRRASLQCHRVDEKVVELFSRFRSNGLP